MVWEERGRDEGERSKEKKKRSLPYADVGGEETGVNDERRGDGERVDEGVGDESSLFSFKDGEEKGQIRSRKEEEEKRSGCRIETHHSVIPRLTERTNSSEFPFIVDASSTKLFEDLSRSYFRDGVSHSSEGT